MASWTSGQVEFWQDRHANQIASGVQGGLLVYIISNFPPDLYVPTYLHSHVLHDLVHVIHKFTTQV